MSDPDVTNPASPWPYLPTLLRLVLAVGCGVFVGLEREHHGKAGVRTFGLAALLGCVGGLAGDRFATLAMACLLVLVGLMNWRQFTLRQTLALTTSTALLLVGFAGVFCGQGHTFTPVAVTVITAALLAWKETISGFVVGLSDLELRSAILLAILSFLIYPVLPARAVDPWGLIEPQGTWITVLLIAALGFVNYVLWKLYGPRGFDITSFLGGLVNSTAAVAELAQRVKEGGEGLLAVAYRGTLLATAAMLLRNSLLLALLAWPAWVSSLIPLALMILFSMLFIWKGLKRGSAGPETPKLNLEQPFSLKAALKFGLIFLALHVAGTLAQKRLGTWGFYAVSVAGGLVSSASAVAAAGTAAAHREVNAAIAANGAVLASLTSTLVDIPLVARVAAQRSLTVRLSAALGVIAGAGIVGIVFHDWLRR
ncbi:MAG: MgtC/SapB family protein [Verrucomicrobia bacterium]|nr:MgtC/SapB family protein [Verrucomicrobiota bacterium]